MAETSWPDPAAARVVTDIQFEQLEQAGPGDGVAGSPGQSPVVYADSTGRQVKIRANKLGKVRGHPWFSGPVEFTKTIAANATGQSRIDLIVLRLTRLTWAVTVEVKAGVPGAPPATPALTQDLDASLAGAGVFEIPLATVLVAPGVAVINAADVGTVAPYLGYPSRITMPSYAALLLLPAPIPGMTALVGDQLYLYSQSAGIGWRRADWGAAWGIVGGNEYTSSGAVLALGVSSTEVALNMTTGNVALVPGRRYEARFMVRHFHSAAGANAVFFIKENSISGLLRASYLTPPLSTAGYGYGEVIDGEWSETVGGTRAFFLYGYNINGTMNINRSGDDSMRVYARVADLGPSTGMAGPI